MFSLQKEMVTMWHDGGGNYFVIHKDINQYVIHYQGMFNFKGSDMLHFPLCAISQGLSVPYVPEYRKE